MNSFTKLNRPTSERPTGAVCEHKAIFAFYSYDSPPPSKFSHELGPASPGSYGYYVTISSSATHIPGYEYVLLLRALLVVVVFGRKATARRFCQTVFAAPPILN